MIPISQEVAEKMVSVNKNQSSYLLRQSTVRNCFVVTIYTALKQEIVHYLISPKSGGGFTIQDSDDIASYPSVGDLLQKTPLLKNCTPILSNNNLTEVKKKLEALKQLITVASETQEGGWTPVKEKLKQSMTELSSLL